MYATISGHLKIVSLLLESDANVNLQDNNGHTAFHSASNKKIKSLLTSVQNLDTLSQKSLDKLFETDPYFWTLISKRHSKRIFDYFVDKYVILLNLPRDIVQSIF